MNETDYQAKNNSDDVWKKLSSDEKADAMAYRNILNSDKTPNAILMKRIQRIHDRHDEFDMSCVP